MYNIRMHVYKKIKQVFYRRKRGNEDKLDENNYNTNNGNLQFLVIIMISHKKSLR